MKSKMIKLFSLLAVFLCLTAFSTVAYAQSDVDADEVITGVIYSDTAATEEKESTEAQSLTPEGNMSLVDDDGEDADDMQFITVVSRNGNYFYIIIDRSGDGENTVHFLNQVDEADLLALMDEDAAGTTDNSETEAVCICTTKCTAGSANTYCAVCKLDITQCCGEEPEPDADPEAEAEPEAETSGSNGTLILVLVLALAGGGAYYYFKIHKPKSKGNTDLDDYDFGDDDDEPDVENEDYDEVEDEAKDETDSEDSGG